MTRSKPLSKRKDFQSAIVVSAEWSNMAGIGATELGLLARKRSLELWSWLDEDGAERIDAGDLKDWRGAVEFLVNSDAGLAAINPFEAIVSGEPRYVGQILAMAWSDDEDSREAAVFLARLPDDMLAFLDREAGGVLDDNVQNVVSELISELHECDLTPSDLPVQLALGTPNVRALRASVGAILKAHKKRLAEAERKYAADRLRLEKWAPQLHELRQSWTAKHPYRRAGGMSLPPVGLNQLISYVEGYLLEHSRMPSGRHEIPGKANAMGGTLDLLVVDFDHLLPADEVSGSRDKPAQ